MRLTLTQVHYIKRLAHVVNFKELRTWDQRALRGLHIRGLFYLDSALNGYLTRQGEHTFETMREAKYRKNWDAPLFKQHKIRYMRKTA